jgi:hypothetical protein
LNATAVVATEDVEQQSPDSNALYGWRAAHVYNPIVTYRFRKGE